MKNTPSNAEGEKKTATLSREVSEFLLELSIGVHRYTMYPPGHPSLLPVAENILGRLSDALGGKTVLSIGVAQEQLVLEGLATESRHPVLRDLARRLHGHQLAALTFRAGTGAKEVVGLLQALSKEPDREVEPLGLLPPEDLPDWDTIRLTPVGYDRLKLWGGEGEGGGRGNRATELWLGLAQSAMAKLGDQDDGTLPAGRELARSIEKRGPEKEYDQVIVDYLHRLAEELKGAEGQESAAVREQVNALINALDEGTLARLVEMGGNRLERKSFLLTASQGLAVQSVMRILDAAMSTSEETISNSMTRLLAKLSVHAESGPQQVRAGAGAALRDNVESLLRNWELDDPNPGRYTLVLDGIARSEPLAKIAMSEEEDPQAGAIRLMQMSLEVDSWGPIVEEAATDLMEAGNASALLGFLRDASPESLVGRNLYAFTMDPTRLSRLLASDELDDDLVKGLEGRFGSEAIPALMDTLTGSESRPARRRAFDALVRQGSAIETALLEGLQDPRWYVIRNMLALAQRLPALPKGLEVAPFLDHEDARVRREAYPVAFRDPGLWEWALAGGLVDVDDRVVRLSLAELQEHIPEALVPVVVKRIVDEPLDPSLHVLGIRALGGSPSPLALDCLIEVCDGGRSLLGRQKLLPASPQVLAALQVLAERWSDDHRARPFVDAARRSKDPRIQEAVDGDRLRS